jgi:transcription elongation factor Elf1
MSMWIEDKYIGLVSPQLEVFKRVKDNHYNFRCPFCGDSKKSKWKARGYVYPIKERLNFKCHNCGHGTNLGGLLEHVDPFLAKQYRVERFKEGKTKSVPVDVQDTPTVFKPAFKEKTVLDKVLSKAIVSKDATDYLASRGIASDLWPMFYYAEKWSDVEGLDPQLEDTLIGDEPRLIIPFYDADGALVAVQGRALDDNPRRYLTAKIQKDKPLIFNLDKVKLNERHYVTEGPFDSLFLPNAMAVGGSDLKRVPHNEHTVYVFDNQPRNAELVRIISELPDTYNVCIWPNNIEHKDINDMILAGLEVEDIINNNTYNGLRRKLAFSKWSKV